MNYHGYRMARQWDVPVQLDPLHRHGGNDNSGWGRILFHGILVPSPHPDPCLSDQRRIVSKYGIHRGTHLSRPSAPVLMKTRLDLTADCYGPPLCTIPAPEFRNTGVDKLPVFR